MSPMPMLGGLPTRPGDSCSRNSRSGREDIVTTGWHYTSWRNWESIQKEGLQPYTIDKPELYQYFDLPPKGIWVWRFPLDSESELGSVIYQLANRAQTKIVKLSLTYDSNTMLTYEGNGWTQPIILHHTGLMERWEYHKSQPEACIVTTPISAKDIELVRVWDLMDLVK